MYGIRCTVVHVISLVNRKGGAGKTTTAAGLVFTMQRRGLRVGLVDVDPNGSAAHWFEQILDTEMVPCHHSEVAALLDTVRDALDVLVIDSPPNDEAAIASVTAVSDLVLIPLAPTGIEVDQLPQTVDLIPEDTAWAVVPVRVRMSTAAGQAIRELLSEEGIPHTVSMVMQSEAIAKSFGKATPLMPFAPLTTEVLELLEKHDR